MSVLTSQLAAGQTLEMPCNNLLTTTFQTVDASTIGGSATAVTSVLFVDAVLGTAAGNGSIARPFSTVQQAVTYAATTLLALSVQIKIAPGAAYTDPVTVPAGFTAAISAWGANSVPDVILSGNFTLTPGGGGGSEIYFSNVTLFMSTVSTATPATDDLYIRLDNCISSPQIVGNNVTLELQETAQSGNVTATTATTITTDGYSWAMLLGYDPTISPGGYTRNFRDAGHGVCAQTLATSGVPVFPAAGSTVFLPLAVSAYVRADDRADVQVLDPSVQDFNCGVHGVDAGVVTVWLTNLSRVSGTFDDDALLLIHHQTMVTEPYVP